MKPYLRVWESLALVRPPFLPNSHLLIHLVAGSNYRQGRYRCLNIGLSDQLTVAEPADSRRGRDQLTVGAATNLLWITFPLLPVIHRRLLPCGARPTYRGTIPAVR